MDEHSDRYSGREPRGGTETAEREAGDANPLMDLLESAPPFEAAAQPPLSRPADETDFVAFYGLRENPFADSVNPKYFYRTDSHAEAIERMMVTVRHKVSLGMVTGPSGSGKTLVSQMLLRNVDPEAHEVVLVLVTPGMSKSALLREVLSELSVALPMGVPRTQDLVKLLSNHVIDLYHQNRRLVILIDECHFLASESLHILRTITNIEIPECKLVTCLLFGESMFAERLEHPSYASLRSRMYLRAALLPMSLEDCDQYIKFRLMVAGGLESPFDAGAVAALHEGSAGVCREVNKLCTLSLLEGARQGRPRVDADVVRHCSLTA